MADCLFIKTGFSKHWKNHVVEEVMGNLIMLNFQFMNVSGGNCKRKILNTSTQLIDQSLEPDLSSRSVKDQRKQIFPPHQKKRKGKKLSMFLYKLLIIHESQLNTVYFLLFSNLLNFVLLAFRSVEINKSIAVRRW